MAAKVCLSHADYTVGWICALPLEMAAANAMLDEVHEDLPVQPHDHNAYILGSIGKHNIVIACLPNGEYGIASATAVAMQLLSSFNSIRFGLMVGIGGGVPNGDVDIRLGDIVVSKPMDGYGGVVQYDYGKALSGGGFQRTGMLNRPPQILLTAISKLQANHITQGRRFMGFLAEVEHRLPQQDSNFARPAQEDRLYHAGYDHIDSNSKTCSSCDVTKIVPRPPRSHQAPVVHYGLIASANQVVKNSQLRDKLGQELGIYCVEMEAAGLMNNYPCLVIRGICDYADSHKNNDWQGYAASVAAAYSKELLLATSVSNIDRIQTARDSLSDMHHKIDEVAKIQRNMCAMFEKYQSISYCMPFDTNQRLTTLQLDQVIEILSDSRKLEHLKSLRWATALNKRHARQSKSDLMNIGRFWLHPRFRKWESSSINDLILVKGDYKSRLAIGSFCVDFIELLRKQKAPIIWTLQAHNSIHEPDGISTTGVMKDLVCQILRLSKPLQTERGVSVCCAQLQAAENLPQWIDLLGKTISSLPKLYILIEKNVTLESEGTVPAPEQFSWVAAFLRLFGELSRRGCKTIVKIVIVTYSSYGSEARAELRAAENHQMMMPAHRLSGGYLRGTLPSRFKQY